MKYGVVNKKTENTCPIWVVLFIPVLVIVMSITLVVGLIVSF